MKHHIVIVGGGTAGWSTAAILSALSRVEITVVDPSAIPTIGVGESTLPHIVAAHKATGLPGLNSADWVQKVDGTIKAGIEFGNFNSLGGLWLHPFLAPGEHEKSILRTAHNTASPELYTLSQPEFIEKYTLSGRIRKSGYVAPQDWSTHTNFRGGAYHLNAGLYGNLLRSETCSRSNVHRIDDEIVDVVLTETGSVQYIKTKSGTELKADLFIDCTGFRGMLANAVDSKWTSAEDRLFVDKVWLLQLPYADREKQLINATYCHGLGNGWVFHIPLQSRIGTGYIFSSRHTTKEDALAEYQTYLVNAFGYKLDDLQNARILEFPTGFRQELWKKNVVSIGLGGFFCEPIESTAIALAQYAAMELRQYLMMPNILHEIFAERFNKHMLNQHRDVIEFVELHYTLTSRSDTKFWQDYKSKPKSDTAQRVLELYKNCVISGKTFNEEALIEALGYSGGMFHEMSYANMFLGYGIRPSLRSQTYH
jgi:flavin-dependent dehydrogenase